MGVLRPVRMAKIGLLGLKEDRETILTVLHDLRVAQVETVSPEVLQQLGPERDTGLQRRVAEETLRFRGLKSILPRIPGTRPLRFESLQAVFDLAKTIPIDEEVGRLHREDDQLQTVERTADATVALLERIRFYPDRLEYLWGQTLVTYVVDGDAKVALAWRATNPLGPTSIWTAHPVGKAIVALVTVPRREAETLVQSAQVAGLKLAALPELSGTIPDAIAAAKAHGSEALHRRKAIAERLGEIARDWYLPVASIEEALTVESRKFDLFPKMAGGREAFALEAWVPDRDLDRLARLVDRTVGGRTVFYRLATTEEPPTFMDNPPGIRWYEFFIRFYSLPKATEWDPTVVFAIVFPIFFGFMIGDWGYGLVILLISLWMIAGFPGRERLPSGIKGFIKTIMGPSSLQQLARTLVPGAIVAIGTGLYFDSFFGYHVLGPLVHYTPAVRPDTNLGSLLLLAGFIGLAMVCFGFLLGSLKEYFHGHYRGTVGKAGGIVFACGITFYGLQVLRHTSGSLLADPFFWVAAVGGAAFVGGEGLQNGLLGLIEVVSHVLSYTRLVGILLASVILALLINSVAIGSFHSGGLAIVLGVVILVVGQTFNVILSVFEPSIQGMRLMFVEYFSKFYEGDGHEFHPFGADRVHTLPLVAAGHEPTSPGAPAET